MLFLPMKRAPPPELCALFRVSNSPPHLVDRHVVPQLILSKLRALRTGDR